MNCGLHYFQMSEAVRPIIWAFSPTFCHLSPILGPRGHVKIESDSQTSMLNRLIGLSCHGPDQSSLTPGQSEVFQSKPADPDSGQPLKKEKKKYQYANCSREKSHWRIGKCLFSLKKIENKKTISGEKSNFRVHWRAFLSGARTLLSFPLSAHFQRAFPIVAWMKMFVCKWFNEHTTLSHERLFFPLHRKHPPVNLYFVPYAALHEAPSKPISSPSSIQMIINHVIITFTWVHLWNGGKKKYFCQVEE